MLRCNNLAYVSLKQLRIIIKRFDLDVKLVKVINKYVKSCLLRLLNNFDDDYTNGMEEKIKRMSRDLGWSKYKVASSLLYVE
jgi:hypothetical protein